MKRTGKWVRNDSNMCHQHGKSLGRAGHNTNLKIGQVLEGGATLIADVVGMVLFLGEAPSLWVPILLHVLEISVSAPSAVSAHDTLRHFH